MMLPLSRKRGRRLPRHGRKHAAGFTLLEVLVAVAILGLGLTAILSAQFSAVMATAHARHISVALGLARCKMSEIEDQLLRDGFSLLTDEGSGACCEGDDTANISCSWLIEQPVFPEPAYGKLDLDTDLDSSPLGVLASSAGEGQVAAGDISDMASSLSGDGLAEMASGGVGGIASMVMGMVYPDMKAMFEASTRRVTLVLTWTEGSRSYDIELVQWVTQPQAGVLPDTEEAEDALIGAATSSGGTSSGSASSSGRSTSSGGAKR